MTASRSGSSDALAARPEGRSAVLQARILELLDLHPRTDEELVIALGGQQLNTRGKIWTPTASSIRPRRVELVAAGLVTEARGLSGMPIKRKTITGTPAQVWRVVREGEEVPESPRAAAKTAAHQEGLAVAERYARWNIGDASWAQSIIEAYLDPARVAAELDAEGAE